MNISGAIRRLTRTPGFTAASVVNLGLGIGLASLTYTLLDQVVLGDLPYPEADRLVLIQHELPGLGVDGVPTVFGGFQGLVDVYAERSRGLSNVAFFGIQPAVVSAEGLPASVQQGYGSEGFFDVLRASANSGRLFLPEDTPLGVTGPGPSVVSQGRWTGADVGSVIDLEGFPSEILGSVARPTGFPLSDATLWTQRSSAIVQANPEWVIQYMIGRLANGVTSETLESELDALVGALADRTDDAFVIRAISDAGLRARVTPLDEWVARDVTRAIWLLFGACSLVWLVALLNVTGLVLARSEVRRSEWAVRRALGAEEHHQVQDAVAQIVVLGTMAGFLATAIAWGSLRLMNAIESIGLPFTVVPSELAMVVPTLTLVTAGVLLFAMYFSAGRGAADVAGVRIGSSADPKAVRLRTAMTVMEVAVAVALVFGSGLILQSTRNLLNVDPGFIVENSATFRVTHPFREVQAAGANGGVATPFFDRLSDRLGAMPEVSAVGYGSCVPLAASCGLEGLPLRRPTDPIDGASLVGVLQVSPGYVEALGLPLVAGRVLERRDHEERTNAILLSAGVAGQLFGDEDPVGRLLTTDIPTWPPLTVVGVVGDVRHTGLRNDPEPLAYLPVMHARQLFELASVSFVLRTRRPLVEVGAMAREIVGELRGDVPITEISSLADLRDADTSRIRAALLVLWIASIVTVFLGATGVYGIMAYTVTRRSRDLAVRLAVGARRVDLVLWVAKKGGTMVGAGLALGLGIAAAGVFLLDGLLFEVGPTNPVPLLLAVSLLAVASVCAMFAPAMRAARQDPAETLRGD